jgi:HEAT repeat protein
VNLSDLVTLALREDDQDRRWEVIHRITYLDPRLVFAKSLELSSSLRAREREVGAALLGRLNYETMGPTAQSTALAVLERLCDDPDTTVAVVSVCSLGHLSEPRALPHVLSLASHVDPQIRWAVASTLPMLCDADNERLIVPSLLELMDDADAAVREWATFGLGTQLEYDSVDVRSRLAKKLEDPEEDVKAEALLGLARRRDPRAADVVRHAIASGDTAPYYLEAAGHLDDPSLYEALLAREDGWGNEWPFTGDTGEGRGPGGRGPGLGRGER